MITSCFLDRQKLPQYHPFTRLRALLDQLPVGTSPLEGGGVVNLALGEPQRLPPSFIKDIIAEKSAGWSRYPLSKGGRDYLESCAAWASRSYDLPKDFVHADRNLIAVPGTREGLFMTALSVLPFPQQGREPPIFLMPNPSYQVYSGAAAAAGAELALVPSCRENGYVPDYLQVPEAILKRTALCVICSPSNPEGGVADLATLKAYIKLARSRNFVLCADECYSDIYVGDRPASALQAAAEISKEEGLDEREALANVLVFHSLSKRSSAAGLRCGFIVGDARWIAAINTTMQVGGAGVPFPIQAAGASLWDDDAHVEKNRAFYRRNFQIAQEVLSPGFKVEIPKGGFCLWLDVGDGVEATRRLWQEAGIRVMPGAYMSFADAGGNSPGDAYIRIALTLDHDAIRLVLTRLRDVLCRR